LYTSSPSEVVVVLLDLLVKAFDSSNVVEPLHDSGVEQISGDSRTQTGLTNLFKLVITRLSSREPDLILIMLQAVFQTLERRDTMKYEIDKESLSCSQSKAEDLQIEQLSSLVLWLIEDYKRVKQHASSIVRGNEIHNSSVDMNVVPKVTLAEILKKCLLYSPGNRQLARSAMLLAQIIGSSSMVERLKKLPSLSLLNLDSAEQSSVELDTLKAQLVTLSLERTSAVNEAAGLRHEVDDLKKKAAAANTLAARCKTTAMEARAAYLAIRAEIEELEARYSDLPEEPAQGPALDRQVDSLEVGSAGPAVVLTPAVC
ncbi:hypothetical protein IFM89_012161, partial [Coptis chinensis]